MTGSRMETTLQMVSDQVTTKAHQMKMATQPASKVASSVAKQQRAFVAPSYRQAKSEIVEQLTAHQRGRYASNNPYAFLAKAAGPDLSYLADMKYEAAMQAPTVTTTGDSQVIEEYMDGVITDYSTAKSEVRQSFLGRMVGPAFAAGALAAAASLMPFPAGAYDTMPNVWDAVIQPTSDFPHAGLYFASFIRNATICGVVCASPAMYRYYEEQTQLEAQEEVQQQPTVQEA